MNPSAAPMPNVAPSVQPSDAMIMSVIAGDGPPDDVSRWMPAASSTKKLAPPRTPATKPSPKGVSGIQSGPKGTRRPPASTNVVSYDALKKTFSTLLTSVRVVPVIGLAMTRSGPATVKKPSGSWTYGGQLLGRVKS